MVVLSSLNVGFVPLIVCAAAGTAAQVLFNPKDVVAVADFPCGYDELVEGAVVFMAKNGGPVDVHVDIVGLPVNEQLSYHIHEGLVPADGNCEALGPIIDPNYGDEICGRDIGRCKVGDMSGKHGPMLGPSFEQNFVESFVSIESGRPSSIIGSSVALHHANGTIFACSSIERADKLRLVSLKEEYTRSGNSDLQYLEEIDIDKSLQSATTLTLELYPSQFREHRNESLLMQPSGANHEIVRANSELNCTMPDEDEQPAIQTSICEDSASRANFCLPCLLCVMLSLL